MVRQLQALCCGGILYITLLADDTSDHFALLEALSFASREDA